MCAVCVIVWWCNLCMYMHACGCACSCQRVSVRRMISLEYCWFLYLLRNNKRVWVGRESTGVQRGERVQKDENSERDCPVLVYINFNSTSSF